MAHFEETAIGYKAVFQKAYNETVGTAERLATRVESKDLSEKYTWLGNFPSMTEWIGSRAVATLTDFGYTITNKLYEASIRVPNTHIAADKVGLYKPAIEQMAQESKHFGSELVATMLVGGHTNLCYDGKAFFANDHILGATTYDNLGTGALTSTTLLAAKAFMMSIKTPAGKSLRVNPTVLVVGPTSYSAAITAVKKALTTGGESNPTYEMFELVVLPEITDAAWYLIDDSKAIKPFVLQVATDGEFAASDGDEFMKNDALFGTKSFMNAGYGLWQFAYKSTGV